MCQTCTNVCPSWTDILLDASMLMSASKSGHTHPNPWKNKQHYIDTLLYIFCTLFLDFHLTFATLGLTTLDYAFPTF